MSVGQEALTDATIRESPVKGVTLRLRGVKQSMVFFVWGAKKYQKCFEIWEDFLVYQALGFTAVLRGVAVLLVASRAFAAKVQ